MRQMSYADIAYEIFSAFIGEDVISSKNLRLVILNSLKKFNNIEITPCVKLSDFYLLEAFHGPTNSLKDISHKLLVSFFDHFIAEFNLVSLTEDDICCSTTSTNIQKEKVQTPLDHFPPYLHRNKPFVTLFAATSGESASSIIHNFTKVNSSYDNLNHTVLSSSHLNLINKKKSLISSTSPTAASHVYNHSPDTTHLSNAFHCFLLFPLHKLNELEAALIPSSSFLSNTNNSSITSSISSYLSTYSSPINLIHPSHHLHCLTLQGDIDDVQKVVDTGLYQVIEHRYNVLKKKKWKRIKFNQIKSTTSTTNGTSAIPSSSSTTSSSTTSRSLPTSNSNGSLFSSNSNRHSTHFTDDVDYQYGSSSSPDHSSSSSFPSSSSSSSLPINNTEDLLEKIQEEEEDDLLYNQINLLSLDCTNFIRVLALIPYYFYSYFRVTNAKNADPFHSSTSSSTNTSTINMNKYINFAVPTGNFTNILAGYLAKKMGLPISKLIISMNRNNGLHKLLTEGVYHPSPSATIATLAPAMDISASTNFERYLYYLVTETADTSNSNAGSANSNSSVSSLPPSVISVLTSHPLYSLYHPSHPPNLNNFYAFNDYYNHPNHHYHEISLTGSQLQQFQSDFLSNYSSKQEILKALALIYSQDKFLICPHTATAVVAFYKLLSLNNTNFSIQNSFGAVASSASSTSAAASSSFPISSSVVSSSAIAAAASSAASSIPTVIIATSHPVKYEDTILLALSGNDNEYEAIARNMSTNLFDLKHGIDGNSSCVPLRKRFTKLATKLSSIQSFVRLRLHLQTTGQSDYPIVPCTHDTNEKEEEEVGFLWKGLKWTGWLSFGFLMLYYTLKLRRKKKN